MKGQYSYMKQVSYLDSISIDDIGNCIIQANTDLGDVWYLVIRTVLGVSRIFCAGPISDGVNLTCSYSFQQIDYDDSKIDKLISKFIGTHYDFTQISVVSFNDCQDVVKQFPDIRSFFYD